MRPRMSERADAAVLPHEQQIQVVVSDTPHRIVGHVPRVRDGGERLRRIDGGVCDADLLIVHEVAAKPCGADRDSVARKRAQLTRDARAVSLEHERGRLPSPQRRLRPDGDRDVGGSALDSRAG